jgi:hypothetical protein
MLKTKDFDKYLFINIFLTNIRLLQLLRVVLKSTKKHLQPRYLIIQINVALQHSQTLTWYYINPRLLQLLKFLKVIKYIYNFFLVPKHFFNYLRPPLKPLHTICIIYLYSFRTVGIQEPRIILISQKHRQICCSYRELQRWRSPWLLRTTILTTPAGYITAAQALTLKLGGILIYRVTQ